MRVVALRRYPVKSMQGEELDHLDLDDRGVIGDRRWAVLDPAAGVVLTGRRDPALLMATGRLDGDGRAEVVLPAGRATRDDDELSAWLGRPVRLVAAADRRSTYEIPVDPEDDASDVATWQGPPGSFVDSTRTAVSIVATGEMGSWDVRRFRPNVVIEADDLDHLLGATVRIGAATLTITKPIDRCVMVARPQPGGIDRDLDVLRTINRERGTVLGIGALVAEPGRVAIGDELVVSASTRP
ncbi:MAG: MOSC N-terminal beta barrel domain-containing protein [Acidimicrobiales bacterium]